MNDDVVITPEELAQFIKLLPSPEEVRDKDVICLPLSTIERVQDLMTDKELESKNIDSKYFKQITFKRRWLAKRNQSTPQPAWVYEGPVLIQGA